MWKFKQHFAKPAAISRIAPAAVPVRSTQAAAASRALTSRQPDTFVAGSLLTVPTNSRDLNPATLRLLSKTVSVAPTIDLDLAALHNIRNRMQVRLGVTATHGLLRAVQIGAILGLVASTALTIASPWIHIFGLGACVFTALVVGSIIIGLVAQKAARIKYFRNVTTQPEFRRDLSDVKITRQVLGAVAPAKRTGEQNAQLFLAKRIEREVAWGAKEQFAQVLRGFFGENELILTSKLMN